MILLQERIASFQRILDRCHSQAQSLEASIQAIWQDIFTMKAVEQGLKTHCMLQERIASFQRALDRCHSQAQSLEASIQVIWQGISK